MSNALDRRAKLLGIAKSIEGVIPGDLNAWMGCLEGEIATSTGVASVSIQDGSNGDSDGPFQIPAGIHKGIKSALKTGNPIAESLRQDWEQEGNDEISFDQLVGFVRDKAKPGVDYYLLQGENPVLGTDPDVLRQNWINSLDECPSDWDLWEDMTTDQLAEKLREFGLDVPEDLESAFSTP
jgi:hypothetical protein